MGAPTVNRDRQDLESHGPGDGQASFAETALTLGGKSVDEARRTGAIDKADDQVEALFAPQYQTVNSPVHRAVWDRGLPVELFEARPPQTPPDVQAVMDQSIEVVRRQRQAGTLLDAQAKISDATMSELGEAGYWGLLVDKPYGGSGAPFGSFAKFLTRMAMVDPTVAGLASVHGCIGAVDPVRTFGNAEQKERFLPGLASGAKLSAFRAHRALRWFGPDGPAHACRVGRRPLRGQRRKTVHHQRGAGPDHRPGLPGGSQAGRADRRLAGGRKRKFSAQEIRPVRAQAHVQPGDRFPRFSRAGCQPAAAGPRRRFDDRLSRPEPGADLVVCAMPRV